MTEYEWHIVTAIMAVVLILEGLAIASVLRHLGGILLRLGPERYGEVDEGPGVGQFVSDDVMVEPPGVIFFVSQTCSVCKPLVGRLPAVRRSHPELEIIPIAIGDSGPAKKKFVASLGGGARGDLDHLYRDWLVPGTPYAVAVGPDGTVMARGVVNTVEQIEVIADAALAQHVSSDPDTDSSSEFDAVSS